MIALVVVRDGVLPVGALEAVAEAGGRGMLAGSGTAIAAVELGSVAHEASLVELGDFQPGRWAQALAEMLIHEPIVVLPASPDGRDLAPRLAARLGRPLFAQATAISRAHVSLARWGGQRSHLVVPPPEFVATLLPGVRGVELGQPIDVKAHQVTPPLTPSTIHDAAVLAVLPPDASTIDLAEAPRILGGGAGLDGAARFDQLAQVGSALGASVGATRVITDRGWIGHERQIGTTGVVVDPELYLAFGISGAVQHTSGLGQPTHIISVNTDAHCPMMQLADLAVVADANEVLAEMLRVLHLAGHGSSDEEIEAVHG
jgi:electron transfer flavoprotein alpha subunit